jgi:hypothetical protein
MLCENEKFFPIVKVLYLKYGMIDEQAVFLIRIHLKGIMIRNQCFLAEFET